MKTASNNPDTERTKISVSKHTRRRLKLMAAPLDISQDEMINRALDALEKKGGKK